jgi:hypothetical protein
MGQKERLLPHFAGAVWAECDVFAHNEPKSEDEISIRASISVLWLRNSFEPPEK